MSRIIKGLGGFKVLLTLLVVGLITALTIVPGIFNVTDASIQTNRDKNVERRTSKTVSHEAGLENYDIRLEKNDYVASLLSSFRTQSGFTASDAADARVAFVRGEEQLRTTVSSLKVEYSPDLRVPEVITPSVWGNDVERLSAPSSGKRSETLRNFVKQNDELFGIRQEQADELVVTADYENPDGNLAFAHLEQQINGIPVFRGEVKAGFTKDGQMIRVINNLAPGIDYSRVSTEFGDPTEAVKTAFENVRYDLKDSVLSRNEVQSNELRVVYGKAGAEITAEKMYFPTEPGVVRTAWRVLVWKTVNAYYVITDAETGAILWRKNLTQDQAQPATYGVYRNSNAYIDIADSPAPISPGPINPALGTQGAFISRTNVILIGNEAPNTFNNLGWITDGGNTTEGNNTKAGLDRELPATGSPANPAHIDPTGHATGSPNRVFDYTYAPLNPNTSTGDAPTTNPPTTCTPLGTNAAPTAYQQGAVTQLFYTTNRYHDKLYELGFNEAARNFQNDNFGRGGTGNDRVSAQAQDCSGTNNANFTTPADGTSGTMQMFIFTGPSPDSDGDLDADVVIHELTHGTSNRLIGNSSGLSDNMSGGMGEGWGDFLGHAMLAESSDPVNGVYAAGAYATFNSFGLGTTNSYYGIRRFPKAVIASTGGPLNRPHNPLTFADLNSTCSLSDGAFAPAFSTSPADCDQVHNAGEIWSSLLWEVRGRMVTRLGFTAGTTRVLQVVTDGMKLSPNNPTFVQARDAIMAAAGTLAFAPEAALDVADVREGFRLRGMGFTASVQASDPAAVTEAFDPPNVRHVDPFAVAEAPAGNDHDGFPEPGENVILSVPVTNPSTGQSITNVQVNVNGGTNVNLGTLNDGQTAVAQVPYSIPIGAACGSLHQVAINVSSSVGTQPSVNRSFRIGALVEGAIGTGAAVAIPGTGTSGVASPYPGTVNIAGLSGSRTIKLELTNFSATFPGDMDLLLVGPGGQKFIVMSDAVSGFSTHTNATVTIHDGAASSMPTGGSTANLLNGEWKPTDHAAGDTFGAPAPAGPYQSPAPVGAATFASVFGTDGATMNGTWSLFGVDDAGGDVATITGWKLSFEPVVFACNTVSVAGRTVNSAGRGLGGVSVSITDGVTTRFARTSTFGFFSFSEVPLNVQQTIAPKAKRYTFPPQQVTPAGNVSGLVFTGTQ